MNLPWHEEVQFSLIQSCDLKKYCTNHVRRTNLGYHKLAFMFNALVVGTTVSNISTGLKEIETNSVLFSFFPVKTNHIQIWLKMFFTYLKQADIQSCFEFSYK